MAKYVQILYDFGLPSVFSYMDQKTYEIIDGLIKKYHCYKGFNNQFDNEDVMQHCWIIILDNLDKYKPEKGPLENWINKILANRLKNLKRDNKTRSSSGLDKVDQWHQNIKCQPILDYILDQLSQEEADQLIKSIKSEEADSISDELRGKVEKLIRRRQK